MLLASNQKQIEKELVADIFINRNKVITQALFNTSIFHGYDSLLIGEAPEASLSITSRIFGFCGGSHQIAAAMALEHIGKIQVPPNAHLIRSIVQAAEILQNSIKWFYTSFAPDLANPAFQDFPLYPIAAKRYQAFHGTSFRKGIFGNTYPIALLSLLAGQWPYADYIIPGGLATPLCPKTLQNAKKIIQDFRQKWLEPILLKDSLEAYLSINSWEELLIWLDSKKEHQNGDLGQFLKIGMAYGLDRFGGSKNSFLSFGAFWKKNSTLEINPTNFTLSTQFPSGIFKGNRYKVLDTDFFINHLKNESCLDQESLVQSLPSYETGSLARMLLQVKRKKAEQAPNGKNLIKDIYQKKGASVFVRTFARLHEMMLLCDLIEKNLTQIDLQDAYHQPITIEDGIGFGMTEAPRGSLGHLVEIKKGRIHKYQILAPTVCNINSGVLAKKTAPLGQALIGKTIKDLAHPIEVGIIARSFDTCLRCTVNLWKSSGKKQIGQVVI